VTNAATASGRLKRVLTLWDLVFFGIICITPIAPIPLFGVAQRLSNGQATATILIAMVAMLITAVSYGRMAALFPVAGSAYTYVGRGLNGHLGFLAGWAMFLDYLLIPMINTIYCAVTVHRLAPGIPYVFWAALFAGMATWLNLRGIRTNSLANEVLLIFMGLVLAIFAVLAVRYLIGLSGLAGLMSLKPIYDPATFNFTAVRTATSFAALTYIGFDSVTTLAEEVDNPRRNVPLATMMVCLFTGLAGGLMVYLGQLVWPEYRNFPNVETAFMDVTRRVGGVALFNAMAAVLVVAQFGSGLTGQAGAARLLYGMGRENVLPEKVFGRLDAGNPAWNILIVGTISFGGALVFDFEGAAEVLNFGAFLAFMGVNLATCRQFYFADREGRPRFFRDLLLPVAGFLFCLGIWVSLPSPAKIIGGCWLVAGLIYDAISTRGFRTQPAHIEFVD
jgi:putrescine importer